MSRPARSEAEMAATDSRIVHIEGRVDRLETDVGDIKAGVKELLSRPVSPGFGQVIGTLLSTLAACAILAGFGEWRIEKAIDPIQLQSVENKQNVDSIINSLTDVRVLQAVLEERSRWLQQLPSWETKTENLR